MQSWNLSVTPKEQLQERNKPKLGTWRNSQINLIHTLKQPRSVCTAKRSFSHSFKETKHAICVQSDRREAISPLPGCSVRFHGAASTPAWAAAPGRAGSACPSLSALYRREQLLCELAWGLFPSWVFVSSSSCPTGSSGDTVRGRYCPHLPPQRMTRLDPVPWPPFPWSVTPETAEDDLLLKDAVPSSGQLCPADVQSQAQGKRAKPCHPGLGHLCPLFPLALL